MRAISSALLSLLATGQYVFADLWTITLNGGVVVRWTSAAVPLSFSGTTWAKGPGITRSAINEKAGPDVATLQVTFIALATDLINGTALIPFIAAHGFDGATVKLERGFAPDWHTAQTSGLTGTVIRFAGKITSIDQIQGATAQFTVSSWMVLLNVNMPRNVYQVPCIHTVYDPGCTLSQAANSFAGTVAAGGAGQTVSFGTSLTSITANDFAMGRMVFTSGANNGITRTVKSNDAAGNFTLVLPLPHPLASGDAFTAIRGCDLLYGGGCLKFNNQVNFKGTPFVPPPRTVVGSATSTTTTKSGK